ncbi:hypothetical protein [Candidatus Cyanaurora vandensis]|uniref:hypothetical protein n=1 Tax=Candidatus Cyanaurora vandensis TaxID=2714958 RepID=UPI00257E28B6|nr:hypothetical protein [Candidatus Cyanaurora vandensis]
MRWDLPAAAKFLLILGFTLVGSGLVYELLIRRVQPIAFLFGLKPRQDKRVPQ